LLRISNIDNFDSLELESMKLRETLPFEAERRLQGQFSRSIQEIKLNKEIELDKNQV